MIVSDATRFDELLAQVTAGLRGLDDDELTIVRDRALSLLHAVRAELRQRRSRPATSVEPVERIRMRASCVFCRGVFQADAITGHLLGMHRGDIVTWASRSRTGRAGVARRGRHLS